MKEELEILPRGRRMSFRFSLSSRGRGYFCCNRDEKCFKEKERGGYSRTGYRFYPCLDSKKNVLWHAILKYSDKWGEGRVCIVGVARVANQ